MERNDGEFETWQKNEKDVLSVRASQATPKNISEFSQQESNLCPSAHQSDALPLSY